MGTRLTVAADEMQRNLPVYLQRVEAGEAFVILKAGKAVAEIIPARSSPSSLCPYGLCAGEFIVPEDLRSLA